MQRKGKKIFPGKNKSNIFFFDNKKNNNVDLNKYINKTNNTKEKNITNNKAIKETKNNKEKKEDNMPAKKRVLRKYNSTTLKKGDIKPFLHQNDAVKKRQLTTHRSVDNFNLKKNLKNVSLTEPDLSKVNINSNLKSFNLNKVTVKHRILGSNRLNMSFNAKESSKKPINKSSSFTAKKPKDPESSKINQSKEYYNKFINKKTSNNKNNINNKNNNNKKNITKNENKKYRTPKEEIFLIKKEKMDDNIIDINSLKRNFIQNKINFISLTGVSSSLVPINKDSVKLILNANDIDSNKFNKIEKILKSNGLKLNEVKNNFKKKSSNAIFPAQSKWDDGKYGGREAKEKLKLSMEFQKKNRENKFHKKNLISKDNYFDVKYKNNNLRRNKSVE